MPLRKAQLLKPADLRRSFSPSEVPFETSDLAPECQGPVVGQDRAKRALEFGLAMRDMDYHVYVAGPQATGKTHLVRSLVEGIARQQPPPPDWVYVHNFRQPDQPRALRLVPGGGRVLAKEMADLVMAFRTKIPELFESEEYSARKEEVLGEFKRRRTKIFSDLDHQAKEVGYVLRFEPTGIMVAPAGPDGEPLDETAIREMDEPARADLRQRSDQVQGKVTESLRQVGALEKELAAAMSELDREMVLARVGHLLDELFDKYAEEREVLLYLEQVREEVVAGFERFKKKETPQLPFPVPSEEPSFKEFEVNVFIDNSETEGAPVLVERHPTHPNLFGRIERQAQFGALITDFTLLKSGSLHKANGGYLVLPMIELLRLWFPWEALKRALKDRKVVMEDMMEQLGYIMTRTLRPEPIPLELKVILVGDSQLYHLLYQYDPDFPKLFKVRAQMADRMHWDKDEVRGFMAHLCSVARQREMLPLHRGAVARLIELAAELAEDRERLTLRVAVVEDVLKESEFFSRRAGRKVVMAEDVATAVAERRHRSSMMEERLREAVTRGFINLETEGARVGQINGLAVLDQGDHAFGHPGRITATLSLGKEGVVDIEREAELSGPFHTKGVLILTGFLRDRFGGNGPLALTAGLVFEQSYGMIDGDSASLAELLALLSRLSGAALRQDLAVTGSVSQLGQVQAIGGVNVKVEGFFRLCEAKGLTGTQGVVIPAANVKNLMLHPDVVDAVRKKKFSLHAVDQVDQAIELFTGIKAGARGAKGLFTKGSVNWLVEEELTRLREAAKEQEGDKGK
jgi:predicted ATP-dependent protease